jgi:hypothetical protein
MRHFSCDLGSGYAQEAENGFNKSLMGVVDDFI